MSILEAKPQENLAENYIASLKPGVVPLNRKLYREGSKGRERICNFLITDGGIGDYICYTAALRYIAIEWPQILGHVFASDHVTELIEHILEPWSDRWKVWDRKYFDPQKAPTRATFAPKLQPLNATGAHPFDLGFHYFCGVNPPPPEYNFYPQLDLQSIDSVKPDFDYAVMTPGATTENRTLHPEAFNGIKNYIIEKGLVPLFLGKKQITNMRTIGYKEGYDYEGGVDLREKTSLLEAAALMSKARFVVGLDNGLLHLAACTEVPVIFGYNIASPTHRRPRRKSGKIWEVYPPREKVPCIGCQSEMRFMFDHDYAYCLYKDNLCLDALNDMGPWRAAIDDVLK